MSEIVKLKGLDYVARRVIQDTRRASALSYWKMKIIIHNVFGSY